MHSPLEAPKRLNARSVQEGNVTYFRPVKEEGYMRSVSPTIPSKSLLPRSTDTKAM